MPSRIPYAKNPIPIVKAPEQRAPRDPFYDSPAWRAVSRMFLSAHPLCLHCLARQHTEPATQVHHSTPLKQLDHKQRLSWSYLVALCIRCHSRVTRIEQLSRGNNG